MACRRALCGDIVRYAIKVAYDGTNYCGWQIQPNGITVQQRLQEAVKAAFGADCTVTASGRTDSGVHAVGQVCHLDLPVNIAGERLADALNVHLPQDIGVLQSAAAYEGFDANRSAKKKTYCYRMYFSSRRNPLYDRYCARVDAPCNADALREVAAMFIGEHDFTAYCSSGSQVKTTVREIYSAEVSADGDILTVSVCGNGFLYNMVRTLVGTMLWYSLGKLSAEDVRRSLTEGRRELTGKTMPAKGLTLLQVEYSPDPFDAGLPCRHKIGR